MRPQTEVHFLIEEKEKSSFILSAFTKHFHSDNILTEMRKRMLSIEKVCVCVEHLRITMCDTLQFFFIYFETFLVCWAAVLYMILKVTVVTF